ncbi:plastocyanin/azurin family copper-binding protein [Pseudohoeflea coraliihabitans]|uniref:Blue (type 1) copper domain-containing protein n=1 Tax=Pseudohoeflea coraliihabitans TaxID=2860393 RepID=A0ABS6WPP3_9HYPH|nr:plastocyanin/azurin family copper-binding protein [Pseudohoeflea sp. DP4N28-3]MBW3097608.1 hypothetical protein [Pseudohoeflea sp. DP4N28-3]
MMLKRRQALSSGGGVLAALACPRLLAAAPLKTIFMRGSARGERIWFDPVGLAVAPGTRLRFINRDQGNSHTATSYHPDNYDRERRIPVRATPWDSGFLLPGDSFEVTLTAPGVYDYYCIPHEMAGMVGRIVVGMPEDPLWEGARGDSDDLAAQAAAGFPSVETILRHRAISQEAKP